MRGGFKIPLTYILGPMTEVICTTRISEYKLCNAISIFNMSYIDLTEKAENLSVR